MRCDRVCGINDLSRSTRRDKQSGRLSADWSLLRSPCHANRYRFLEAHFHEIADFVLYKHEHDRASLASPAMRAADARQKRRDK